MVHFGNKKRGGDITQPAKSMGNRPLTLLLWVGVPLLCQVGITLIGSPSQAPWGVAALYLIGTLASLRAVQLALHGATVPLPLILVAAVALRALALPMEPGGDMNRYLWEGRLTLEGGNPYATPPNDPSLDALAPDDPYRPRVNHPEMTAIYPPLTQLFGAAVTSVWARPLAFKIAFTLLDLATLVLVLLIARNPDASGRPTGHVLAAAIAVGLSPLLTLQNSGEAHNESLWIFFALLAAFLALRSRPFAAALALGAALASKQTAAFLLPVFLTLLPVRSWILLPAVPLASALPFLDAGYGLLDSTLRYSTQFQWNNLLPPILSWPALILALFFVWRSFAASSERDPLRALRDSAGVSVVLLPTVHIWYACGLVPFCALRPRTPWWTFLAAIGFWYLYLIRASSGDDWVDTPWVRILVFAPVGIAWVAAFIHRRKKNGERPHAAGR